MSRSSLISEFARRVARGPAQMVFDHGVARSTTAEGLCRQLEGKSLQIDPGDERLAMYVTVADGQLRVEPGFTEAPDAGLAGSPVNLARLSGADPQAVIRDGAVTVSGDTEVAEQFQYLLQLMRPDWEDELSRFTGDAVAHEAGRFAAGLASWIDSAGRSFNRSLGEYLTEESQALITRVEVDEFCSAVDTLAADVDRLEATLRILRDAGDKPATPAE